MCRLSGRWLAAFSLLSAAWTVVLLGAQHAAAQSLAQKPAASAKFEPLERWRAVVLAGDAEALAAMYSAGPPAEIFTTSGKKLTAREEIGVWVSLKKNGLTAIQLEIVQVESPRTGLTATIFEVELATTVNAEPKRLYASLSFLWEKQGQQWRVVEGRRTDILRLRQPSSPDANLYSAGADAQADLRAAIGRAAGNSKRVLVVFGADWCYDCHVLEAAFHLPEIAPLLAASYEVVHVDIGENDKNLDILKRCDVPLEKGIPALAVLDGDGKLLFSHKKGEFEATRLLGPEDLVKFLNEWKPNPRK